MKPFIIGTRGSALALAQAEMTEKALAEAFPGREFVRKVITTTGDRRTDVPLSQVAKSEGVLDKGVFTKELEVALENGEIDLAVHSMKDVPTVLAPHFAITGVLERAPVRDVLISKANLGLDGLKQNAVVATSSVRRQRQLLHLRPDLKLVDIRGNVPTRIQKLAENPDLDAIMLAEAGLVRLGYHLTSELVPGVFSCPLEPDVFLPAAGQGIVGFESRADDQDAAAVALAITHAISMMQSRAEREFLRLLDAGCHTPVGVSSVIDGNHIAMAARVFDEESNDPPKEAEVEGLASEPEKVAAELYAMVV
ncbi:MAG: hydroxymethylbilane synthase [Akkermansiaceae bacterium]